MANPEMLTIEQRQRFGKAAERALRWRSEKIMVARLTFFWACWFISGKEPNWHALFECERHGHHPLSGPAAKWVGPYDFEDTIDTSGRFGAEPLGGVPEAPQSEDAK